MRIINLTNNAVMVAAKDGGTITYAPAQGMAAIKEVYHDVHDDFPFDVSEIEYVGIHNLPDPEEGVYYIVSKFVKILVEDFGRSTSDLLTPGRRMRDDAGFPTSCVQLHF